MVCTQVDLSRVFGMYLDLYEATLSPFWNLPLYYEIRCWNMYVGFLGPSISIRMLSMTLVTLSATVKKPYMVSPSNYDLVGHPHHPLTIHEMVPTAI